MEVCEKSSNFAAEIGFEGQKLIIICQKRPKTIQKVFIVKNYQYYQKLINNYYESEIICFSAAGSDERAVDEE